MDVYTYDNKETREIREWVFTNRGLSKQNFIKIVQRNKTALNMRHSLIMDDFHKLSSVYSAILTDPEYASYSYSFYNFFNGFCTEVSPKKFREYMRTTIDKDTESQIKHPTRQIMILLWLYDFCFSFTRGVEMIPAEFEKIQALLNKYHPEWARDAENYYSGGIFDAYGFINGYPGREIEVTFDGSHFISLINKKLVDRYSWGTLNPQLPFDYYILQLYKLYISHGKEYTFENCGNILWDSKLLAKSYTGTQNVPRSLVVISDLMEDVKTIIIEKQDNLQPLIAKRIQQREPEIYKAERENLSALISIIPRKNDDFIETTSSALHRALQDTADLVVPDSENEIDLEKKISKKDREVTRKVERILSLLLSGKGASIYFDKKSVRTSRDIAVPSKYTAPIWVNTVDEVIKSLSSNDSDIIEFTLKKFEIAVKNVIRQEREKKKNKRDREMPEADYSDFVKSTRLKFKAKQEEQELIVDVKKKIPGILELIFIFFSPTIRIDQRSLDDALDAEARIQTAKRIDAEIKKELGKKLPPFPLDCRIYEQI